MKRFFILFSFIFTSNLTTLSQVKIGDNPDIIDKSSILELDSSSKALVITRVTNIQMNLIFPLEGAIVYNTDHHCIFQFSDMKWKSLCDQTTSGMLNFDENTKKLSFGSSGVVDLSSLVDNSDNDPTNELQVLTFDQNTHTLNLLNGGSVNLENAIRNIGITATSIADDAVTNPKIADNAVKTDNIANGTIKTEDLASGGNDKVLVTDNTGTIQWIHRTEFGAVSDTITITGTGTAADPFRVKNSAITTNKIADNSVTAIKIADGSIGTLKLKNDAVSNLKILNNAITKNKIAKNAVNTYKIENGSIETIDLASGGNDKVLVTDNAGTVQWINKTEFGAVSDTITITGTGTIADPFNVKDSAITTNKIADNAITNTKIANGSIGTSKLEKYAVSSLKIRGGAVTKSKIAKNSVNTDKIANGSIKTEDLASGGNDKVLVTDSTGTIQWIDKTEFGAVSDTITITGTGTAADPFKAQKTVEVVNKTSNYTLKASDNGKVFTFNSTSAITLTVPSGLFVGFNISIYQTNTGKVTISGATGVNILNRLNRFKTAGKNAGAGLVCTSSNSFHLTGDLKL